MTPPAKQAVVGLALLCPVATRALAQSGREYSFGDLHLTGAQAELFIEGQYRDEDEDRPAAGVSSQETDLFFEEGLELTTDGYYFHPNLVDFFANVRLGLTQQDISINDEERNSEGFLVGYNLLASILRNKPVSARVFASLTDQFVARSFSRPIDLETRTEGFELRWRDSLNASLLFEHSTRDEASDLRIEDEEIFLVRTRLASDRSADMFSELIYEFETTDETVQFLNRDGLIDITQDLPDQRHEMNFTNRWRFGDPGLPHFLTGRARLMRRRGFFDNDVLLLDQRLDLSHTPDRRSFYSGAVSYDTTDAQEDRLVRGEVGVAQRVYDSLEFSGRVFGSDRQFENGSEQRVGGLLDADYRKRTPVGVYRSGLSAGRTLQAENFDGGVRNIRDEAVVLDASSFARLSQPNAVPGTVVVTDATNTITFIEGIDYELRTTGAFTEIRRLIGGTITPGELVLVDYSADTAANADFYTDTLRWSHRIELDGLPLALYAEIDATHDRLISGDDPGNLERRERYLAGVEVDLSPLTVVAEYEVQDQELSPPWDAYRFRGTYHQPLSTQSTLDMGAHYEMLEYRNALAFGLEPGEDFRESYGAFGRVVTKVGRNLLLRFEADAIETRGRDQTLLLRLSPSLSWQVGDTELSLTGRYTVFEQNDTEGTANYLSFTFTRRF